MTNGKFVMMPAL